MTKLLSELLQASEPYFRQGLKLLEAQNGHPNADIRFSTEVQHASKVKLQELGLDPHDTTPEELYHALQERVKADDARLTRKLRTEAATHISAQADVVDGMIHALQALPESKQCFALKGSTLKSLLKKNPPKKAMKQLGYRSLDSFLKHEAPTLTLAAAWLSEGRQWQERLLDQYKRLHPSDFETRSLTLLRPASKRWQELAERAVAQRRHNLLSFKELGAIVFLPLSDSAPAGTTTVSLCLALHELNEIRAASTFLKLNQVRSDFGKVVRTIATGEPHLSAELFDQPLPWRLVQRHYADGEATEAEQAFEPHLQRDDMVWQSIEQAIARIEPSLEFWHGSSHLGLMHNNRPVSFNIVDAALNFCNQLPFERRIVHYFQNSLWHELLLRYLGRETVERAVIGELQPELELV